ncbi:OsmC family protein [Sulfitobacter sp. CS16]|uniref:OsmC family protein n=1 Tax=Sulfitobacter sp. CS16 TaxID=3368573 RepID=UPI0037465C9B
MIQIRAFAKRMDVKIDDLSVNAEANWQWTPTGRIYETAPKSFHLDVLLESSSPLKDQIALTQAARKRCFVEQTLGQANFISHRIRTDTGLMAVD